MQPIDRLHIFIVAVPLISFMTRTLALSFFLLGAFCVAMPSCKRDDKPQTRLTRLQHTWKLVKTATDANGNGAIDASEIQPINIATLASTIAFNENMSGNENVVANGVTTDYPFTWTINAQMDTITRNGIGHNVVKYYLADISSIAMELTTMTDLGVAGYFYEIK